MSPAIETSLLENLRRTNARLRGWLENVSPDAAHVAAPNAPLISALLSELMRVGACLRAEAPDHGDLPLQNELGEYRRNLEHLRHCMPSIQRHLVAERARLEAERARLDGALEWAQGSRQTL